MTELRGVRILYEDNHVIVAVKPHMLPSQADASGDADMLSILKEYIKEKYSKPGAVYLGLVHRLDRPTAGVMVFARTSKAAARLSEQVRNGGFDKIYACTVKGTPPRSAELTDWLLKDERTNMSRVVPEGTPGAKKAVLRYELMQSKDGLSRLRVRLLTGRSHQIRVQLASRGWPVYGDARYGGGEGEHLQLVCESLSFTHPTTKERMTFTADSGEC